MSREKVGKGCKPTGKSVFNADHDITGTIDRHSAVLRVMWRGAEMRRRYVADALKYIEKAP